MRLKGRSLPGILAGLTLFAATDALAYLDPGSGSILLQMLIGGIAAALYTLKLYWRQLRGLLSRLVRGRTADTADIQNESQPEDEG